MILAYFRRLFVAAQKNEQDHALISQTIKHPNFIDSVRSSQFEFTIPDRESIQPCTAMQYIDVDLGRPGRRLISTPL